MYVKPSCVPLLHQRYSSVYTEIQRYMVSSYQENQERVITHRKHAFAAAV